MIAVLIVLNVLLALFGLAAIAGGKNNPDPGAVAGMAVGAAVSSLAILTALALAGVIG